MLSDGRTRRVVLLSHCILNQNVRYTGGAHHAAVMEEVVDVLRMGGVGFVQMPCPEFALAGVNRPAASKEMYDTPRFREICASIAVSIADQAEEYAESGFAVLALLGIERSPSCGVKQTTTRPRSGGGVATVTKGRGILIEELQREFATRHLQIPFRGLDWRRTAQDLEELRALLSRQDAS